MAERNFYEVLGVPRSAKNTDIGRAWRRWQAETQKESAPPDERRSAAMQAAFETLSDPGRRAEYDALLDRKPPSPRRKQVVVAGAAAALVVVVAAAWVALRPAAKPAGPPVLTAQQVLEMATPLVGRVQGATISGEVKAVGLAVSTAAGEMVTTCHALPAASELSVTVAGNATRAEIARADEQRDLCTLKAKDASTAPTLRTGDPAPGEKLYVVAAEGAAPLQVKEAKAARSIPDPNGSAFALDLAGPVPNGAPVFDAYGKLAGIVTAPHAYGGGIVAALGAARIAQARGNAAAPRGN